MTFIFGFHYTLKLEEKTFKSRITFFPDMNPGSFPFRFSFWDGGIRNLLELTEGKGSPSLTALY